MVDGTLVGRFLPGGAINYPSVVSSEISNCFAGAPYEETGSKQFFLEYPTDFFGYLAVRFGFWVPRRPCAGARARGALGAERGLSAFLLCKGHKIYDK